MEAIAENYSKGEIVWAKLSGYPWWPGAIADIEINVQQPSTSVCIVKFFGQNSQYNLVLQFPSSLLALSKIAKYTEFFSQFSRKAVTSKKLRDSIEIAQNILKGKKNLKRELAHVKVSLEEMKQTQRQLKTALTIEDQSHFHSESANSNEVSCSQQIVQTYHGVVEAKTNSHYKAPGLDSDDLLVLQELEFQGINQKNIISLLEYGLLKRLSLVDKQKSIKLNKVAKKVLLDTYFSKPILRKQKKQQKQKQIQSKNQKSVKSVKPLQELTRKRIHKENKKVKLPVPQSELQILCVKRLYSILKTYQIDSENSRLISSTIVAKLKTRYGIDSLEFKREYLTFINWLRCHCSETTTIINYQDHYIEEVTIEEQISKRSDTTDNSYLG